MVTLLALLLSLVTVAFACAMEEVPAQEEVKTEIIAEVSSQDTAVEPQVLDVELLKKQEEAKVAQAQKEHELKLPVQPQTEETMPVKESIEAEVFEETSQE